MAEEKPNTCTPKIDPRIIGVNFSTQEGCRTRALYLSWNGLRNYLTEQTITNGLGFFDVINGRCAGRINHYKDSDAGLQEHLRAMEDRCYFREYVLKNGLLQEVVEKLFEVEDSAERAFKHYENLITGGIESMGRTLGVSEQKTSDFIKDLKIPFGWIRDDARLR